MYYSHFTATSPSMTVSQIIQGCTKVAKMSTLDTPKVQGTAYNPPQDSKQTENEEFGTVYEQGYSIDYVKGRGDPVEQYYRVEKYHDGNISINKEKTLRSSSNQWQETVLTNSSSIIVTGSTDGSATKTMNKTTEEYEVVEEDEASTSEEEDQEVKKVKNPVLEVDPYIVRKKEFRKKKRKVKKGNTVSTKNVQKLGSKKVKDYNKNKKNPNNGGRKLIKDAADKRVVKVNKDNLYLKNKKEIHKKKRHLKRNMIHIGNYLTPTFAAVMKRTEKFRSPNVLEQVPFIAGQSLNKSHNLAARLQENRIFNHRNYSRAETKLQISKIDLILSNQMHMINNIKSRSLTQRMLPAIVDYNSKSPFQLHQNCDKNKLIKNVLQTLHTNFSQDLDRQEELETKIKTKTDCNQDVIEEFKDLCEKLEEDENVIKAFLLLVNDVYALNHQIEKLMKKKKQKRKKY